MSYEADQLRAQLAEYRGLWHCTLEDKAAMDANLLRVETERDRLREALQQIAGSRPNKRFDPWARDVARAALALPEEPSQAAQWVPCEACKGTGEWGPGGERCPSCGGTGEGKALTSQGAPLPEEQKEG